MKICYYFFPIYNPKIAHWEIRVAELLRNLGHDVSILSRFERPRESDFDLIYVSNLVASEPFAMRLHREKELPIVLNILDVPYWRLRMPNFRKEWFILRNNLLEADLVTAISRSTTVMVQQHLHVNVPIEVNYIGVDLKYAGVPEVEVKKKVVYVGSRAQHKRVGDLVEALTRTKKSLGLTLVTENYTEEEKFKEIRSSWALVNPSVFEGFSIPVCEALIMNRPVIVRDLPVYREIYGDRDIVKRFNSLNELVELIEELDGSSNPDGRRFVLEKKLTLQDSTSRLSKILEMVI